MSLIGAKVGDYVGDFKVHRIQAGNYHVTGPRGHAFIKRGRLGQSWHISGAPETDAHGQPARLRTCRLRLNDAIESLVPLLCYYRPAPR